MSEPSSDTRWQSYVRHAVEPLFLLDRRRRLVFANAAWEACTGLVFADVRGQPCRLPRSSDAERGITALPAFAPPPEAFAGQTCRARRRAFEGGWWHLEFFPIQGEQGLLGILAKLTPLAAPQRTNKPLPDRAIALRDRLAETYRLDALPTESPALARLVAQARLASQARLPLTLLGEPGTGKHWLARAIHQAGPDRERAFARLEARGLPLPLLEDVLFTARVPLGTLYLPEPADLPREVQARLVQRLGADDAAPRLIVGQRGDPAEAIRAGRLLAELHYAVSTLTIAVPPLRERLAELEHLARVLLARAQRFAETGAVELSAEALQALRSHGWPGNLRELDVVLSDAARRAKGPRIELGDLPFYLRSGPTPAEKKLPLDELLEQAERRLLVLALRQANGNRTRAADLLGIWRPRLLRRLEHFGIAADDGAD